MKIYSSLLLPCDDGFAKFEAGDFASKALFEASPSLSLSKIEHHRYSLTSRSVLKTESDIHRGSAERQSLGSENFLPPSVQDE